VLESTEAYQKQALQVQCATVPPAAKALAALRQSFDPLWEGPILSAQPVHSIGGALSNGSTTKPD
jgi:hypothetical protein